MISLMVLVAYGFVPIGGALHAGVEGANSTLHPAGGMAELTLSDGVAIPAAEADLPPV